MGIFLLLLISPLSIEAKSGKWQTASTRPFPSNDRVARAEAWGARRMGREKVREIFFSHPVLPALYASAFTTRSMEGKERPSPECF